MTEEKKESTVTEKPKQGVSRRQFIAGTVGGVVVGAVVGAATGSLGFPRTIKPWMPTSWDYEADIVVVGAGPGGSATTVFARNAGADVILLEKGSSVGGTSSYSTGQIVTPVTLDAFTTDLIKEATDKGAYINAGLARISANNQVDIHTWLAGYGSVFQASVAPHLVAPGVGVAYPTDPKSIPGVLKNALDKSGAKVLLATKAMELIKDPDYGVVGVNAYDLQAKKTITVKARKAVMLATGDLSSNPDLTAKWVSTTAKPYVACPTNTGDGYIMAKNVGASLVALQYGGGIDCNTQIQAIDESGNVIPRLYATGYVQALNVSNWHTGMCGAMALGRAAVASMVAEKPWS